MKKLQNDLTTIEQSKRLLELGVPKNSANHYYGKDDKLHYIDGTIPYSLLWETGCTPCWSVGRMIEILLICTPDNYDLFYPITSPLGMKFPCIEGYRKLLQEGQVIDTIIEEIEERKQENTIDFSKLED